MFNIQVRLCVCERAELGGQINSGTWVELDYCQQVQIEDYFCIVHCE